DVGDSDGIGDGGGYFLDPTPLDSSEFEGSTKNAFSGYASATLPDGSPNPVASQGDLYELVLHEMGHALGFTTSAGYSIVDGGLETNTKVADTISGSSNGFADAGFYWRFDGPSVKHLMTSFDSGGQSAVPADFGFGEHSAPPGASVTVNSTT